MNCAGCGHENPPGARFCNACGGTLAASCPACGAENPEGARFCNQCGASFEEAGAKTPPAPVAEARDPLDYTPKHLAEKILRSKSALEGERKQVTVLFADVKGSMDLAEQVDVEEWHRILSRFFEILTEGIHRFEGTVNQYTGDGIMALFGAPIAHENHAQRACFAALHLRDEVRRYANELRVERSLSFGARLGLNSGEVVVGKIGDDLRMDYTAQGHTVGLAQRMEQLAESGHICLSEHTARLVDGYFALSDLGRSKVKGVGEPVGIFELDGVGQLRTRLDRSRARGLSTFVGRDDEVALLDASLRSALAGEARVVGVVAQAGVGKSRLCSEFLDRCRAEGIAVHETHCPAHGQAIPLLPILDLLRGYFGLNESDTPRAAREKIAGRLLLLDREFDTELPWIWELLRVPDPERPSDEVDGEEAQQRLFAFTRRLIRVRSENEPAVLLFDDLHWIDPASDAVLAEQVAAVRGTRTLLLVNFRPEYRAEWMQRSHYQQLPLAPLGSEAIRELLASLLGPDPSVAGLPALVEERTAGNPFFTEEVVQSLIESEHLVGERGDFRLVSPVEKLEIPDEVRAVLAARIDRLGEREKRVLQTAAVIGKHVSQPLLEQVSDLPTRDLDDALRLLCEGEFLFERALYPVAEYAFKHPLTQEVAYSSQLADRRRAVHRALAATLEAEGESAALLAYHYDAAGEALPAIRWHRAAVGERGFLDPEEYLHHWGRVKDLADTLDTREGLGLAASARAQILWGEIRRGADHERADRLFEEARALAEKAGDTASLARAQFSYAVSRLYGGRPGSGAIAEESVRSAEATDDVATRIAVRWAAGATGYFSDDVERARAHATRGIELCGNDLTIGTDAVGYSPWIFLRGIRATVNALSGRTREALADLETLQEDHGAEHRLTQGVCLTFGVTVHRLLGSFRAGLATAERGCESLAILSNKATRIFSNHNLGIARCLAGDWEAGREALEIAQATARSGNLFLHIFPEGLAWMGLAYLELGDAERAKEAVAEGFELAARIEMRVPLAQLHLSRARIGRSLEPGDDAPIRDDLSGAEAVAREVGARMYLPEIHLERGALEDALGDAAAARAERKAALHLYREMEAGPNAERIAAELDT